MNVRSRRLSRTVALLCCAAPSGLGLAQSTAPLSVEAALAQPSFQIYSPITLSPDGAWVAYTLAYPNRANETAVSSWFTRTGVASTATGTRVRITDVRTGSSLIVGDDAATSWGPAWSPDGRSLAFYSNAGGVAGLWIRETATGRTRRVSDAIVRAHRAIQYPRWTPDSRRVVMPILPYGSALPEASTSRSVAGSDSVRRRDSATVRVLRADPALPYGGQAKSGSVETDIRESLRADLALVDVGSGAVTTLATGYWPHEYSVAPSGRYVAFSSERPPVFRTRWMVPYDLMVVPLDGQKAGAPHAIATGVAIANYAKGVFWSPTSATILYSAMDSAGRAQYFVADSSDWRPRRVATTGVADVAADSTPSGSRSVWWDDDGRAFYIVAAGSIAAVAMPGGTVRSLPHVPAPYRPLNLVGPQSRETALSDGGTALVVAFRNDSTKRMGFARLDLRDGVWRILREEARYYGNRRHLPLDVTADGRIAYHGEDAQHPADVWLTDRGMSSSRRLTRVAPEMEGVAFGATRLIDFPTPNGMRRAALLLPAGYRAGTRYPLVVYPYPIDPRSNDVNTFGITGSGTENMQLLATRGFAVLAPDVAPFEWTNIMRELAAIILPGVDRVISLGVADSARIGIMGHSLGGYMTLALITQSQRFGAAVMRGGEGDEVAMTGALQSSGFAYGIQLQEMLLGGTVWDRSDVYQRNSPIYLLDRVRTPLLIIHGEGETTVPIFLADQVFAGLQRLGREVEFARYAHENHVEVLWSYANQRDYLSRMLGWFQLHLQPERDPRSVAAPRTP